jgi:hypothetical protein
VKSNLTHDRFLHRKRSEAIPSDFGAIGDVFRGFCQVISPKPAIVVKGVCVWESVTATG